MQLLPQNLILALAAAIGPMHEADDPINYDNVNVNLDADDPDDDYAGLTHSFARACKLADAAIAAAEQERVVTEPVFRAAISTLRAARYLVKQNDPKRFEVWLLEHSERERAAIITHLRGKS